MSLSLASVTPSPYPESLHALDSYFMVEIANYAAQNALYLQAEASARSFNQRTNIQDVGASKIEDLFDSLFNATQSLAQSHFSTPGFALETTAANDWLEQTHRKAFRSAMRDVHATSDALIIARSHYRTANPFTLWDYISSVFSPEVIRKNAQIKAAKRIVSAFGLRMNPTIKTTGRHVELVTRVWTDKKYRTDQRELHYNGRNEFITLADALITLSQTADLPAGVYDLRGLANTYRSFGDYGFAYSSRQKYTFAGDIVLTLFNNEFKLCVPMPLAAAINLMIAEYGDIHE